MSNLKYLPKLLNLSLKVKKTTKNANKNYKKD